VESQVAPSAAAANLGGVTHGQSLLGLDLQSPAPRPCGLCGVIFRLSKAHVPPQAAGNDSTVRRAWQQISEGVFGPSRLSDGGMWVRGLCAECNSMAGGHYDRAYVDFARALRPWVSRFAQRLMPGSGVPAVYLAPGLVAKSVLYGMHAISPNLRTKFPQLALDLCAQKEHIPLPVGLRLRVGLYANDEARLAGPIHSYRVLGRSEVYGTHAEVYFPPLAWVLSYDDAGMVFDTEGWASADEWPLYGDDVTRTDLRDLTKTFPTVVHPPSRSPLDWVHLYSDEITPMLLGSVC
jgi:hypothetical protein